MTVTQLKKYIQDNNKIDFVLNSLGCSHISFHSDKDYYSCSNIDGDNPSAINIRNNEYLNYRNWTRNIQYDDGQDLINLVEQIKNCGFRDAIKWLHEILGLDFTNYKQNKGGSVADIKSKVLSVFTKHISCRDSVNVADIEILDEHALDEFSDIEFIGLLREGITPQTCARFGVMYSYRQKRIIFPHHHWLTGDCVGYNARTTIDGYDSMGISKYRFSKGFNKSNNLYGLYENYDSILHKGYVVVMESEKSVLKRDSQFDKTVVALGTKHMTAEQKRILIGLDCEIVVALDKDVPLQEIRNICEGFYGVRKISYIYDKDNLLEYKDAPCDKGDSVYRQLLKDRISYDKTEHEKYLQEMEK